MRFEPIAIVGRACRVPGADTPEALFALARAGRVTLTDAPAGRWRAPDADVLVAPDAPPAARLDRAWTKRGGYVESPLGGDARLDPLVHLLLATGREALHDAGDADGTRTGAVVGNLSLPSSGLSAFAEHRWLGSLASEVMEDPRDVPVDARNAFMSGLPAHLMARGLGLGLGAYALDAACASSLYAIEHACRALQERRADRMVAGAVNRADDLFIHVGFAALGALSKSGQSRPFHADADGLVPGEGCALVVLERLDDALRAGRTVHGVIRGVGLCNDGRGQGLLAPSETGQARSMREAFAMSGLRPDAVPYVECHATGTPVGDGVELASTGAVYATGARVGSLKANLGHLITAAGAAGLIRVLECLREGVVTPTPSLDRPSEALRASKFEALREPAPWTGPRRAGVSAFGFGGNDAHLLVETLDETQRAMGGARVAVPAAAPEEVVVVALGARVGAGRSRADLEAVLFDGVPLDPRAGRTARPRGERRVPPPGHAKASGQQIIVF
ncbi:MAG: polyketide synthase [Myxococcota bacterium]